MEFLDIGLLKSGALRTITEITKTGFELTISASQNAICFFSIAIPKKSYFTIFAIQNFVQNIKNT